MLVLVQMQMTVVLLEAAEQKPDITNIPADPLDLLVYMRVDVFKDRHKYNVIYIAQRERERERDACVRARVRIYVDTCNRYKSDQLGHAR